ncbi:hypothetical protein I4U23_021847 [Adineta vaga]|nr:hypothetical protein I4U23_021847 [Adineta vaga]
MTDKEYLLNTFSKLSTSNDDDDHDKENDKQVLSNSLSDWRQCFDVLRNRRKYDQLDDNDETVDADKNSSVGLTKLIVTDIGPSTLDANS